MKRSVKYRLLCLESDEREDCLPFCFQRCPHDPSVFEPSPWVAFTISEPAGIAHGSGLDSAAVPFLGGLNDKRSEVHGAGLQAAVGQRCPCLAEPDRCRHTWSPAAGGRGVDCTPASEASGSDRCRQLIDYLLPAVSPRYLLSALPGLEG